MKYRIICWLIVQRRLVHAEHQKSAALLLGTLGDGKSALKAYNLYQGLTDPAFEIDLDAAKEQVNEILEKIETGELQFMARVPAYIEKEARQKKFKQRQQEKPSGTQE